MLMTQSESRALSAMRAWLLWELPKYDGCYQPVDTYDDIAVLLAIDVLYDGGVPAFLNKIERCVAGSR